METVNNSRPLPDNYYVEKEGVPTANPNNALTQSDFFALLTEQLAQQDPTKPVDNDQMIAQMTSFTMADSLAQLNDKFDSFASSMTSNQALQASSLIGQSVLVPGNEQSLSEGGAMRGTVITDQTVRDMQLVVENDIGQVMRVVPLGTQAPGNIEFNLDGLDQNGNVLPPGNYRIRAQGTIKGEGAELQTALYRQVQSVSLASASQGVIVNLSGTESVKLSDVLEISGS